MSPHSFARFPSPRVTCPPRYRPRPAPLGPPPPQDGPCSRCRMATRTGEREHAKGRHPVTSETNRSLWRATVADPVPSTRFDADAEADLAVIGGGFTGCAAALDAARRGAAVSVFEADTVGPRRLGPECRAGQCRALAAPGRDRRPYRRNRRHAPDDRAGRGPPRRSSTSSSARASTARPPAPAPCISPTPPPASTTCATASGRATASAPRSSFSTPRKPPAAPARPGSTAHSGDPRAGTIQPARLLPRPRSRRHRRRRPYPRAHPRHPPQPRQRHLGDPRPPATASAPATCCSPPTPITATSRAPPPPASCPSASASSPPPPCPTACARPSCRAARAAGIPRL